LLSSAWYDLQWGNRELYFNVAALDQTTRVSVIDAMTRTGVPPVNSSYYLGHYVKLTFLYFFWYTLGSIIDFMGGSFIDAHRLIGIAPFPSQVWKLFLSAPRYILVLCGFLTISQA